MTCMEMKRRNEMGTLFAKPKNGRILLGVLIAVLLIGTVVAVSLYLHHVGQEQQIELQQDLRNEAIEELERGEGTYDTQSIVLYNTSRAKAEELAEKLGASLRMTKDGSFATLTLPEGTTILDVYRDEQNLPYIEQMSADWQVRISDLTESEDDESGQDDDRLPMRPTYAVSDTEYELQTYLDYLNMQNVWSNYRGYGITVAVIDTGIDTDHPEFAGRISEYSYNATEDKIVKDYVLENGEYDWSLVEDEQGHGTAVTGVIAASMNSNHVVGIAPEVTIITIKAECNPDGSFKRTSDLVFGIYYAIERDVNVVNMSFGTHACVNPFAAATQLAYDSDVICVAAAGNEATASLCWPAADPNVIGVGALAEGSWELAEYSNFGENVDVVAPGTTYTSLMDGEYGSMNGTSLASPVVTGLIALYMQNNPYLTFDRVSEELYASSYDLGDLGRDWYYGFGAVDAHALLLGERGTVTFDMLTDEVEDEKATFIKGNAMQELPEPERLYAVFDGWYYDEHCTQRVEYYTDAFYGDLTLYASWVNEDDGIPFTYVILDDGTVEIRSYTGHRRFITVPEKIEGRVVSSIGDFAFAGQTKLREVGLPSGLCHIGLSAFEGCYNLVSIYIPENVTEIERNAFKSCVRLSTVAFTGQSKLHTIGKEAFRGCGNLRTIELPASLQSIDATAFMDTSELTSIRVQSGNQSFKSEDGVLFDIDGQTLVVYPAAHGTTYAIPEGVKTVGNYAFYGAKVIFLDLGKTETIGECAFANSSVLTVNIPDSVTSMGDGAFMQSSVRELTIGAGLTEIAGGAFARCLSLRVVHIPAGIQQIKTHPFYGGAFGGSGLQTLTFAENSQLVSIDNLAFAVCQLTELRIPASVEFIGSASEGILEPGDFDICNPSGAFDLNPLTSVIFEEGSRLKAIGNRAFAYSELAGIDLPEGLECLGAGAFWSTPLETVTLPASLIYLGDGAFGFHPTCCKSSKLTSITVAEGNTVYHDVDGVVYNLDNTQIHAFPAGRGGEYTVLDTARKVMPYAFAGTSSLERVTLPEGLTEIGNYGFCFSGSYTYDLPSTLLYIKNGGFYSNFRLNSITLPEGLEQIAEYAFYDCGVLPTIHIPDSVLQIGRYAFAKDWSLYSVTFNETAKLPRISFGAFSYCGISSFRVPANVSTMAQKAFEECPNLTEITFAENSKLESISAYMFDGCSNLQTITFEAGSALTSVQAHGLEGMDKLITINWGDAKVTNIDNFAFRFCESLSELTLPETVTNVGRYAFYGCKSLSELTLPANLEHIGSFAFLGTGDLNLYMSADTMPAYLDEDWDHGIRGYYVGVTSVQTQGDYKYAILSSGDVSIIEYVGSDTELDLSVLDFGAPITAIGGSAFEDKGITRVILPETLTSIQAEAFAYNPLEEITIPASVTFIGREAFTYTDLAKLTFAKDSQIANIEQYAFEKTENLTEVTLPASLTTMGRGVFQESGLTGVTFEKGIALTRIPENAFAKTKLQSIALPDSVNYIDHNAFREIATLQSVTFGSAENISLQSNSFYHTGLTSLHIPANVTYIGEYSFVALTSLTEITVDEGNPYYKAEDGLLLSKDGRKLIVVPAGRTGSLSVPVSVEMLGFGAFEESKLSEIQFDENANILTLGYRAFFKANNITTIDIPKSVISIDYYAFAYCENLETVNFAEGNQLKGIYEGAFLGDINLENITIPESIVEISDFAFFGCSKIDRIPTGESNSLKGIYSYAFAYTGIEGEFTTPETLIDIGDYAFLGTKITKLTVPATNQRDLIIGIGAFEECNELEEVTLPFIGASLDDMEYSWFGYVFGAGGYEANATYVPKSLKTVTITEGQTFVGKGGLAYITTVETLNLPHSICVVYNNAFKETTAKHELTNTIMTWYSDGPYNYLWVMPGHFGPGLTGHLELAGPGVMGNNTWTDGVTQIYSQAFSGCMNMTNVTIPDSVVDIGVSAFSGCSGLTGITIPDSITSIAHGAFHGCSGLTEVNLPDSVTSIGAHAFEGCKSLTSVESIWDSTMELGEGVFAGCTGLKSVTIPDGVTNICGGMFSGCTELKNVSIPDSVTNIGASAFNRCIGLETVILPDSVASIGEYAFYDCSSLMKITLSKNLTEIERDAFMECHNLLYIDNRSNLHLEMGSDHLGEIARWTKAVKQKNGEIVLKEGYGLTEDGLLYTVSFWQDYVTVEAYLGSQDTVTIPSTINGMPCEINMFYTTAGHIIISEGFESINLYGFGECINLTRLSIPSSVWRIDGGSRDGTPGRMTSVKIDVSPDNPNYHVSGDCLIETQSKTLIMGNQESVIPADGSVECIGQGAFQYCYGLNEIVIPDSVTSISESAFASCTGLTKIKLPNGLSKIGDYAFSGCVGLTDVTIPNGVTTIGENAFFGCESLTSITIPESVTRIQQSAFSYCFGLKSIVIPKNVTQIEGWVFSLCRNLETVVIPQGVTGIGEYAFYSCNSLQEIVLPESIASIGAEAFPQSTKVRYAGEQPYVIIDGIKYNREMTQIIEVVDKNITFASIPEGITVIEGFEYCNRLTEVIIPKSATTIGTAAFHGCASLTSIVIPDNVTVIDFLAFAGCSSLTDVYIGTGVVSIIINPFEDCGSLSHITVAEGNPVYRSVNNCVIQGDTLIIGCSTSVIPDDGSVDSIHQYAFMGSGIANLVIPDSVRSIGEYAFCDCNVLTQITLGKNLMYIGQEAFVMTSPLRIVNRSELPIKIGSYDYGEIALNAMILIDQHGNVTNRLDTEYFSTDAGFYYQVVDGVYTLCAYLGSLDTITLPETIDGNFYKIEYFRTTASHVILPPGMTSIDKNAFDGCNALQKITIPDSVTHIEAYAFSNCSALTEVYLPDSIVRIDYDAFYACKSLKNVRLSNKLQCIPNGAFVGCSNLTNIIIPENVTSIESQAFFCCTNLRDITFSANLEYIGYEAFLGCGFIDIVIPDSVQEIGSGAFRACISLTKIIIPDSVQRIGDNSFRDCCNLTEVIIPDNVRIISSQAFADCTNLKNIKLHDNFEYLACDAFNDTAFYNDESNWVDGCLILDGWLLVLNPDTVYMDADSFEKIAWGVYEGFHLLKSAVWAGSVVGATNVETLIIKDIENAGILNNPYDLATKLPLTVKNIIITKDVDLTELHRNSGIFKYVSGVTIFVERTEKDLRWDDNFPGWNNGNRVVYGDNWSWVTFYDEQGNIISREPCKNEQVIRKPVLADKDDAVNTYVLTGWDIDGDGTPDSVPATSVTDLDIRPIFTTIPKEYTIVFKDSETGEIYKQEILHYGDVIIAPETPTREDGFLLGWIGYNESMTVTGNAEFLTDWHVHDMCEWYVAIEPTCTAQGTSRCDCSRCNYFETEVVPALGHDYAPEWTVDQEPTCTEAGSKSRHCTRCGDLTDVTEIPASGHEYEAVITAPTCMEKGYTTHTCHCGDSYVDEETDALDHDMGEWYVALEPTCTAQGTNQRDCSRCDYAETEAIAMLEHVYEAVITAPTCTEKGYTTHTCVCGDAYVDSEVDLLAHTPSDWIVDTEPQIGAQGSRHKECTDCGETLETEAIEALTEAPTTEDPTTAAPETVAPETEAPESGEETTDVETEEQSKGGCAGSLSVALLGMMLAIAAAVVLKKKEN